MVMISSSEENEGLRDSLTDVADQCIALRAALRAANDTAFEWRTLATDQGLKIATLTADVDRLTEEMNRAKQQADMAPPSGGGLDAHMGAAIPCDSGVPNRVEVGGAGGQQPVRLRPRATWVMELNVDCPRCEETVDLTSGRDFWDGRNPGFGPFMGCDAKFEAKCPKCAHEFLCDIE